MPIYLAYPVTVLSVSSRGVIDIARVIHVIMSRKRRISIANLLFGTNIDANGTRLPTSFRE